MFYNKVDYSDKTLPINYSDKPLVNNYVNSTNSSDDFGYSLSGEKINPSSFKHNNMVPFFGGTVKQNMDDLQNIPVIENYTGNSITNYKNKDAQKTLFNPEKNIGLPYGSAPLTNLVGKERYVVSNIQNNVSPIEKVYVGPGVGNGYTAEPSGGFQQAETRDYIMPKTVNELRVLNKPKLSYHMPIISGSKISKRGNIGIVQKNRPDTYAEWGPDRLFVTTGDRVKPRQNAEIVLKHSNRTTTDIRRAMGPASKVGPSNNTMRSNVKKSTKQQYETDGPRNLDMAGHWTVPNSGYGKDSVDTYCETEQEKLNYVPMDFNAVKLKGGTYNPNDDPRSFNIFDYGKSSINIDRNNRNETSFIPVGNLIGTKRQSYIPITEEIRETRKTNMIGNTRWASNVQNQTGHMVYDPTDIPKTTVKETTLQSSGLGVLSAQRPSNHPVYDPTDIPKTTIKETTLSDGILGGAHRTDNLKPRVHDPNDKLRTTHKETTHAEYSGGAYLPVEVGRDTNTYVAKATNKQYTSVNEHYGQMTSDQIGAYNNTPVSVKNTNRQYTSNNEYTGSAGGGELNKPREYQDMLANSTTKSHREFIATGRTPSTEGPKTNVNKSMIRSTTKREGDTLNNALSTRKQIKTKVYNIMPEANVCSETKKKKQLDNKEISDRLDSHLLDPFRMNPYTQSLHSYVF
jgi:hypothetical protein